MNQKYVFLDIDGVLATQTTYNKWNKAGMECSGRYWPYGDEARWPLNNQEEILFCPKLCKNVQTLCEATDAFIVLSTTWRILYGLEPMKELLLEVGITAEVVGETPDFSHENGSRGSEIQAWLQTQKEARGEIDPRDIVILEDAEDVSPYTGRQILTTFNGPEQTTGFTEKHLKKALKMLKVE